MLSRQPLWVPVVKHNPAFLESYHRFLHSNPICAQNVAAMNLKPEDVHVALVPDRRAPGKHVAAMMAFPMKVLPAACDVHPADGRQLLSFGYASALCDSANSFHVMERLLPAFNAHVSVNIQSQYLRPLVAEEDIVVISEIDKMGKRLVYCKTGYFVEPKVVSAEMQAQDEGVRTLRDLHAALSSYEKAVNGTHVKSIIASPKK